MANTPYDDVFRTLLNDCSFLVLPMLNEVFGEHYTGKEEITFFPNEHFINQQEGTEEKRITDTFFAVSGVKKKKYHWECESKADKSILARFFEYDAQIALDSSSMEESNKVAEHIAAKYSKVKGRVKKIMTGQILEYEAKIIKNQGRAEGKAEGIKSVIIHMYSKGFTLSQIAMATDKDESEIRLIVENE